MRCLTLAKGWHAKGGKIVIATNCKDQNLTRHLAAANMPVAKIEHPHPNPMDWDLTSGILNSHPGAWVVLDGYHFDSEYQDRIKSGGHRLLAIDDAAHLDKYFADIILNQNINAEQLQYAVEQGARLLLGLRYVLLRPEFIEQSVSLPKSSETARKLLVTLGGGDFENQTLKVIKAVEAVKIDGLEVVIVVGPANPHLKQLQTLVKNSKIPIQLKVNTTRMAELMTWADMAVTGGGGTCWELACIGLPALVIVLAENQYAVANALDERGAVINLGWHHDLSIDKIVQALEYLLLNAAKRKKMAEISRKLVDGKGTERVLRYLIEQ
jgi:UDP-2,4-diacetamido-2,4,6-trideoxy-beta-L-altropyranose hydrolase